MSKAATRGLSELTSEIDIILQAHFDSSELIEKIDSVIVGSLSENKEDNSENPVWVIYQAANLPQENFESFLSNMFDVTSEEEITGENEEMIAGYKQSYVFLKQISGICRGDFFYEKELKNNRDKIIAQCRPLTTMTDDELLCHVARFFKENINTHLKEKYPTYLPHLQKQFVPANDNNQAAEFDNTATSISSPSFSPVVTEAAKAADSALNQARK